MKKLLSLFIFLLALEGKIQGEEITGKLTYKDYPSEKNKPVSGIRIYL